MANFTPQEIEEMLQAFFDTAGKRQYVGARYVPIFGRAGSADIDWDNTAAYEPLTIVLHNGDSYTSRRYVPAGIDISDADYWVITGRYNAQVEQYRQEVLRFQGQIDTLRNDMESDYVPFPDSDHYPKYGILGQVLTTLADGETKWEDPVMVDAEIAEPLIDAWLDEHPEATTTVENGAITWGKLNALLIDRLFHSSNYMLNANNSASWPFDSADEQPPNSVYFISSNVTEALFTSLPEYSKYATLCKINYTITSTHGFLQIYANNDAIYMRHEIGSGDTSTYSQWMRIWPAEKTSEFLSSGNMYMTLSNIASWTFDDADNQPINTIYSIAHSITDSHLANLPSYGEAALICRMNYKSNDSRGSIQIFATTTKIYMRIGFDTFGNWIQINPDYLSQCLHSSNSFMRASNIADWEFNDANAQTPNTTVLIQNNVTEEMLPHLPKYSAYCILTQINFRISDDPHGFYQIAFYQDEIYMRMEIGSGESYVFSNWFKIYPQITEFVPDTNHHTCNIFRKVVCCGDSYTAGYIKDSSAAAVVTNEDYAWPHYMETITGNTYVNCGHSGATTLSWPTDERGLPKAQASGTAQAYIVGLMINDVGRDVPLGTIANITDVTPTTYYAGLGNIVRELHTISNDAYIFLQTCPRTAASFQPYNQAVRDVVEYYANTHHTHLLDLYEHRDMYENASLTGDSINGHYTAIGYQQFAEILSRILSDYINNHISAFQHVYALPYV